MNAVRCAAGFLAALMLLTPACYAVDIVPATATAAVETAAEEDWQLLLVNPWNKLPEEFTVELKKLPNGLQVDARIYDDLTAMLSDCRKAGLRPVVCSAYRPVETQTRLYNNKIARLQAAGYSREAAIRQAGRWVAVPGTSEHQTGLAVDLVASSYQVLDKKQEQTKEQKWLMEHCWEYGFILRYPSDKCGVTGIGYEPWHYRYVGKETAKAMQEAGLCLEEYLTALESPQETVHTKAR
ncbi:M15 family metallopeptidase [Oscillibacter sp.]|uniref:M15 family metallopeptidase n=1 Tax=Oscillibacter sp. TaxID=1945593 RepID=UPI001B796F50|nr:M15 family metallopeptidase [Oscillibacter sp.]MBP3508376.1 M15 family metallopeptidase [Oscillibacter sp.]